MLENFSHIEVKKDYESAQDVLQNENKKSLARLIDSTILKPQVEFKDIIELCKQANEFNFRAICIPPCFVPIAKSNLSHKNITLCTVIGFPNGYNTIEAKCYEAKEAIQAGATEIDFVQNITYVKSNNYSDLKIEYKKLVESCSNHVLKVILETSLLTDEEIIKCTKLAAECGIHIIKTSTGFGTRGASLNDIIIIKKALNEYFLNTKIHVGIKASGGIRNLQDAMSFIKAGATRLGTSNGKNILQGEGA